MENWKDIPGYEGLYSVSDEGRVWGIKKNRMLRQDCSSWGYPRVFLRNHEGEKRFSVHRLVMLSFVGPVPDGQEVNHKNGIKNDPRLENLEYVTRSENQLHCNHVIRTRESMKGSAHGRSKITEKIAIAIRAARDSGQSLASIANKFNVSAPTVSLIATGKIWRHVVPAERSRARFKVTAH